MPGSSAASSSRLTSSPSVKRKPAASSSSWPGVRMITASDSVVAVCSVRSRRAREAPAAPRRRALRRRRTRCRRAARTIGAVTCCSGAMVERDALRRWPHPCIAPRFATTDAGMTFRARRMTRPGSLVAATGAPAPKASRTKASASASTRRWRAPFEQPDLARVDLQRHQSIVAVAGERGQQLAQGQRAFAGRDVRLDAAPRSRSGR